MENKLSKSNLEYLNTIYILNKNNEDLTVTNIASKLGVSKAAVTKALKILGADSQIEYLPYGKIKLTKQGIENAKKSLEAYDIIYLFFNNILNLDSEKSKIEANKAKSVFDDDTLNKLAKYVYNTLGLNMNCNYDINNNNCRSCIKKNTIV